MSEQVLVAGAIAIAFLNGTVFGVISGYLAGLQKSRKRRAYSVGGRER